MAHQRRVAFLTAGTSSLMRLNWDEAPRFYSEGLDRGVLYTKGTGVPWNGLISVEEQETGETYSDFYLDGVRVRVVQDLGDFTAKLEAYTYPDELTDVSTVPFGLSYRTQHGDAYFLHIVYNALAIPSSRTLQTTGATQEPSTFSWDISALAESIPGASPAAHLIISSTDTPEVIEAIENILYGSDVAGPRLPPPTEVMDIFESVAVLHITYNGDGTWTATGPDDMIQVHEDGSFTISSPSLYFLDDGRFIVSSY